MAREPRQSARPNQPAALRSKFASARSVQRGGLTSVIGDGAAGTQDCYGVPSNPAVRFAFPRRSGAELSALLPRLSETEIPVR